MVRNNSLKILIFAIFISSLASAEEPRDLGKIVVTPSRLRSQPADLRSAVLLDGQDMEISTHNAIADFIGSVTDVDVRRRGPEGVQADINIRGATFEQNAILIDGINLSDPQTGHFSMDLPLTILDIDRIEVLKGPSSSAYGANAFGGTVNVITKLPDKPEFKLHAESGSFDYFLGAASASFPITDRIKNRISFEERRSTGYMPETEFNMITFTDTMRSETPFGTLDALFGYLRKDFGAASFYSNLFPNEEEHTDTRLFKIGLSTVAGPLIIEPKLFLRRHKDKFALDKNRPGWQTNYHTTYDYGADTAFKLENECADIAYGFELSRETIDSTSLGSHRRSAGGWYLEFLPHTGERLYVDAGIRTDWFSDFEWQTSPSVNIKYLLSQYLSARALAASSYRVPTFTDLYYRDSANMGSANLDPEHSWTYEVGLDHNTRAAKSSVTFFHRDVYDAIDWIRFNPRSQWQAANIGSISTNGLEASSEFYMKEIFESSPVDKAFIRYTVLDSYRKHDYFSKYALDYLKQQISSGIECDILGFKNSWVLNFKKRVGDSGFIVVDTNISKDIVAKAAVSFNIFLDISNIFDVSYSEQSDISMPGRWIKWGGRLKF